MIKNKLVGKTIYFSLFVQVVTTIVSLDGLKYDLNDKNKTAVLVPPMFLNSWLCLSKEALLAYKWSFKGKYVDAKDQITVKWNDPKINYKWPIKKPILSKRDK